MLEEIKMEANRAYTENGAVTNRSTGSDCLDLFATVGALRRASSEEICRRFTRAYIEDPDTAMKILFFARDIRGGLGERRVFREIVRNLAETNPVSVIRNLEFFGEYGRFDDLLALEGTHCERAMLAYIAKVFRQDMKALEEDKQITLIGKWLPSVNASNRETVRFAKKIARYLGMNDAEYRKAVVALRGRIKIIENNLREKDYSFDYSKQPSRAMFKYRQAFVRNDHDRYVDFLAKAQKGEVKLHADTLMPYELINPYLSFSRRAGSFLGNIKEGEAQTLNATWASLPDFGGKENALAIVDTSGSMYGGGEPLPASVALSLGLYFAERNKGLFHNYFIEFSARPQLIEIKGETFVDRLRYIASFNEFANTNIEAVFNLILDAAVKNKVPQAEMPSTLYIITDMEFDACVSDAKSSNFENAKRNYEINGYRLPNIVFWNVASRSRQQPVTINDRGVALVSGCSPRLFSMVVGGELNPYDFMMDVIGSERYRPIVA